MKNPFLLQITLQDGGPPAEVVEEVSGEKMLSLWELTQQG